MDKNFDQLCNEILSLVEIQESKLLNWGFFTTGSDLPRDLPGLLDNLPENDNQLWEKYRENGKTVQDVIQNLNDRKLVFLDSNGFYRSRFSETVRMLFLLKQRFKDEDWAVARRLVSDLRIQLQRRRYPKWEIPINELEHNLTNNKIKEFQIEVIKQLLKSDDNQKYFRVAEFQKDSILSILSSLRGNSDEAIVIGAGTGAGKTKAFYIPAMAHIAHNIDLNQPYLQALAIYPRKELLKDQFAEAYDEARKLDGLLRKNGKRPISIGVYYSDTPESANNILKDGWYKKWRETSDGSGYICPFFKCPHEQTHELIWYKDDVKKEKAANTNGEFGLYTKLNCSSCDFETETDEVFLTRKQMRAKIPDLLFTTTEMLNQRISRANEHALFGIDQNRLPRLLLLDEIHTYEGITGSQVAYLIRRWRHAKGNRRNQNLCIVGLSATLSMASEFFSKLTGIPEYKTKYISPKAEDYIEEGFEYNLVLKGDPVSGTSLLSTSVQTAMLLGRILDKRSNPYSRGAYGEKIFAFTDKLDVINRWFYTMNDAERHMRLSQYRRSEEVPNLTQREKQGQIWKICEKLGYDLNQPLRLGRTTSQDPGVDTNAKLIIATTTLEVGFNDVSVGAVIQHKSARSAASFLQRKGRAGRTRDMRPWMVVITSAYGKDRWSFQHAETLFAPEIPPINLPIENYYVHKIQAAYTIMDWAARELKKTHHDIDIWTLLIAKNQYSEQKNQRIQLKNILLKILKGDLRNNFEEYLKSALNLEDNSEDLKSILWGEPRSLYFEVIPTLIRQLETNWRKIEGNNIEECRDFFADKPMPDFVPSALFSDLNIPEVQIKVPGQNQEFRNETMDVYQAITEFSPARGNKRFSLGYRRDIAHWLALPDTAQLTRERINIDLLKIEFDNSPIIIKKDGDEYVVFRPLGFELETLPRDVRSTSNSELIWKSNFKVHQYEETSEDDGIRSTDMWLPEKSSWKKFIRDIDLYTRTNNSWIDVTRISIGVKTDTRKRDGENSIQTLYYEEPNEGKHAGIGFSLSADGIRFVIEPLNINELKSHPDWIILYNSLSKEYFRYKLQNHPRLHEMGVSSFTIDWLMQLELSMITATAISKQCTIEQACGPVDSNRHVFAERTLKVIFQSQREIDEVESYGRLHQQIMALIDDPAVGNILKETSNVLWKDNDADFDEWLEEVYASSIGASIFSAITKLVPDIDHDELTMTMDNLDIWITENTAGGVGIVSKIADTITKSPRNFELQIRETIEHCDREEISNQLKGVTNLLAINNTDLLNEFSKIRNTNDLPNLLNSKQSLSEVLESNGIAATRPLIVSINTKFLRPNSDSDSDALIIDLMNLWEAEEKRLGIEIDMRVMAVAALAITDIKDQVKNLLDRIGMGADINDETQMFNLLQSMLWMNCTDSCPDCIEKWHHFQKLVRPSRNILRTIISEDIEQIEYLSDQWKDHVMSTLKEDHQVQLLCNIDDVEGCKRDVGLVLNSPCNVGYQQFYPVIERITRNEGYLNFQLAILELVGGV